MTDVLIRREAPGDVAAVRDVVVAAFRGRAGPGTEPVEAALLDALRADPGWVPELSLIAERDGAVIGHVLATRALVGTAPALGLGPVAVHPPAQRAGVGTALMQALIGAAGSRTEPLLALLGEPAFYARFGFRAAAELGVVSPDPAWGAYFQVRPLPGYAGERGRFSYAAPFHRL